MKSTVTFVPASRLQRGTVIIDNAHGGARLTVKAVHRRTDGALRVVTDHGDALMTASVQVQIALS